MKRKVYLVNHWRKKSPVMDIVHIARIHHKNIITLYYFVILGIGFIIRIKPKKL